LRQLPKNVRTVLDIGGNIGLFALLARHYLPDAVIHSYEPNPKLQTVLEANTASLQITVYTEGVGAHASKATMDCSGPTLDGTTIASEDGDITITSFADAISRLGGTVDFLKMDCEGAEWSILEDKDSMAKVKRLAMEYHLDEQGKRTVTELICQLKGIGFFIETFREASNPLVGQLTAANRARL
jgi:FkbM family methyltransferase